MPEVFTFTKLSGSGNDFICIDARGGRFAALLGDTERAAGFARAVCSRGCGIGADGLIFACDHDMGDVADIEACLFEPDGSRAELCGNGTACFTRWVKDNGWVAAEEVRILTVSGVVRGKLADGAYVRVCIPLPKDIQTGLSLNAHGSPLICDFAVTGVPHLVTYVEDIETVDVPILGPALRHHKRFEPRGVNANFVQVLGEGEIALRTYEFGVEGETFACGTGSAAAAILAADRYRWPAAYTTGEKPVLVHARSGDVLRIYFTREADGRVTDLCLETVVRFLYAGTASEEFAARALGQAGR